MESLYYEVGKPASLISPVRFVLNYLFFVSKPIVPEITIYAFALLANKVFGCLRQLDRATE